MLAMSDAPISTFIRSPREAFTTPKTLSPSCGIYLQISALNSPLMECDVKTNHGTAERLQIKTFQKLDSSPLHSLRRFFLRPIN